jgi:ketosteroid isomerase-like protein
MLRPVHRPIVAVLAVSGVFAGCGGGPSEVERVHDVVEAFGTASAAKDYQRLCDDLLAPKLVSEVEAAGLPCEVALKQGLGEVSSPRLTIGEIRVSGDAATADVQSSATGEKPSRDTLQLLRVDSSWRIASLK